ncbi:MAG: cytochrome c [Terracidiphilus sp.]|jgi:mono/diheme cytochrome c family protein
MRLCSIAVIVLLIASPFGFASSRSQREHGETVLAASGCLHCHSIRNQGGHKGPDLSGVGRRMNKDRMRMQIVDGSKSMPPFGDDLQGADLEDLLAYLHSCRDKKKTISSTPSR